MGMTFGTCGPRPDDMIDHEVNPGGSTHYRMQLCLGLTPEPDGELALEDFSARLDNALAEWGPDNPGYPDDAHCRAYGRGPEYVLGWLDELYEMCRAGRAAGHTRVVWF